jgi:hypothetical protein
MNYRLSTTALLAIAVFVSAILTPISVAGQPSGGEIQVAPGDVSLNQGETKTIDINYNSLSVPNPNGVEFTLKYDPDVISVIDANKGGYIGAGAAGTGPTTTSGEVAFGYTQANPIGADSGTVATITIELADGVSKGDTTDLTFTKARTIGTDASPNRVDGTVEAKEKTKKPPQNQYDVQIVNPTLSPMTVDEASGTHTLNFEMTEVSADNNRDNVTVTLPDSVTVEDVIDTSVTNTKREDVQVFNNPATLPNPGRKISFAVNPTGTTDTRTVNVEIELTLSSTS